MLARESTAGPYCGKEIALAKSTARISKVSVSHVGNNDYVRFARALKDFDRNSSQAVPEEFFARFASSATAERDDQNN